MFKKLISLSFIFLSFVFLSSCYDKLELEDRDFVITIGIDQPKNPKNKNDVFFITLAIPDPHAVNNYEPNPERIIFGTGSTILTTINNISNNSSNALDFSQTKLVLLGDGILKNEHLLKETIDVMERNRKLSKKVLFLGTNDYANSIITSDINNISILANFLTNYFSKSNNIFNYTLFDVIKNLETSKFAILPLVKIDDSHIDLDNSIIIKDFKLFGVLDYNMKKGLSYLFSNNNIFTVIEHDNFFIPLKITSINKKTFFTENNGSLVYNIDLNIIGTVNEFSFSNSSLYNSDFINNLSLEFSKKIHSEILTSFNYFNKSINIDAFNIVTTLKKKNYDLYLKYYDGDMEKFLNNINHVITVNVTIDSTGSIK